MEKTDGTMVVLEAPVKAPLEDVWTYWTKTEHVIGWNFASDDWHCPGAMSNFIEDGQFSYRMEAKDGSFGFDFMGVFNEIVAKEKVLYTLLDGRVVEVLFLPREDGVLVKESFMVEDRHTVEQQRQGWQAILNNFKKYAEKKSAQ